MTKGANILVVEDEVSQLEMLAYNLTFEGYNVHRAETGEEGLLILEEQPIDLVLLDWMLPAISGLEVCRQVKRKKATKNIPVIMLTARGEEGDKIRGLDTGADDYVVKPYSIKELLARVRVGLRQSTAPLDGDVLSYKSLKIDVQQHKVYCGDVEVVLGPLEFKLLLLLMESPGRVWTRDQLLDRVWGVHANVDSRTVDVHVGRLRKHLAKTSDVDFVRTVRGVGYSLDASA